MIKIWHESRHENGHEALPPVLNPRDVKGIKQTTEKISKMVEQVALEHKVSKTLLFSKRLIRKLAFSIATDSKPPSQWRGWRKLLLENLIE